MDSAGENIERWRLELRDLLDSGTTTEEQIHQFLASTPVFLPLYWPFQNRVFSKLRLGGDLVSDFGYARNTTIGLVWYFIEIESPKTKLFRKNGDPTAGLTPFGKSEIGRRGSNDTAVTLRSIFRLRAIRSGSFISRS